MWGVINDFELPVWSRKPILGKHTFIFAFVIMPDRAMGQRVANTKSNENQVKYRIFDARFNGAIFSMIHGISAVLFDSKV